MAQNKIINLAENLVAAYKEIPYSVLSGFVKEAAGKFPYDRVLQHMDAIIEKRADKHPYGSVYVKDLDALISELSSFGNTERARELFASYLGKLSPEDGQTKVSRDVFTEDSRSLSEVKASEKQKELISAGQRPDKIGEIPIDKIMPDYKISKAHDKQTIGLGANVVNRTVTAVFGVSPVSVKFAEDLDENGVMYDVVMVTKHGRAEIKVPVVVGSFGFHSPDNFLADIDGKQVKYELEPRAAIDFLNSIESEKPVSYDPNFVNASYSELHAALLKRASDKDYRGAEEAIQLIQKKYPGMAKAALEDYQGVLMLFAKAENKQLCMGCSFFSPASEKSVSIHDYCNKLGHPVNEIIKHSDCNKCTLASREAKKTIAGFVGKIRSHNIKIV